MTGVDSKREIAPKKGFETKKSVEEKSFLKGLPEREKAGRRRRKKRIKRNESRP